jgi:hypothetical protein
MDRSHFRKPPQGLVFRPQDGHGPSPVQNFPDTTEESPVSEYSTPKGSPMRRHSPQRPATSAHTFSPRIPQPSRPPRPSEVMPLQAAKTRNYVPMRTPPKSNEDLARYWDQASRPSPRAKHGQGPHGENHEPTSTSTMSDWPLSQNAIPGPGAARKAYLVPPSSSSSRRGGSSPYSQGTSFSPILEESPDSGSKARASVASSRVVPSSWGSHPSDYNFDRLQGKIEEEDEIRPSPASPGPIASMHDTTGFVRQASMGKKMKPSLTKIGSSSDDAPVGDREATGLATSGAGAGALRPSHEQNLTPAAVSSPSEKASGNRTAMIDSSSSSSRTSSQDSGKGLETPVEPKGRSRSPLAAAADRPARQPVSPLCGISRSTSKGPSMSDKVPSNRRPPHLDMEAVRDSEARGSVTSLPDLIRRATRLAANLDRGKTASRAGLLDMLDAEKKEQRRRSGSISDILASFPPPSRGTPDGTRRFSRWPSSFSPSKLNERMSYVASQESGSTQVPRNTRRCCGMSQRPFILLVVIIAVLIAAAVVVPIVLIVLPRQRQAAADHSGPSSLGQCPDSTSCQNGGGSVVSGDTCRCICVNGFTGDRCSAVADPGCITMDIGTGSERITNATLGNAIPRLLSGAMTNYSVPLNSSTILSLFSANDLSCASENALVYFNGQGMKARNLAPEPLAEDLPTVTQSTLSLLPAPTLEAALSPRLEQRQVGTSNGIVFEMSSTATATTAPSSESSSQTPTTASPSSTSPSQPSSRTPRPETVDFARIAVLFVLEQTGQLNTAVKAQDHIEDFLFRPPNEGHTLSLGSDGVDIGLDFANFSISLENGSELGGRGDGDGGIRDGQRKRSSNLWDVVV